MAWWWWIPLGVGAVIVLAFAVFGLLALRALNRWKM